MGRKLQERVEYKPTLYVPSQKPNEGKFKSLRGQPLAELKMDGIKEARDFTKRNDGIENFLIHGMTRYEYAFISDMFPDHLEWSKDDINICNIDIEVGSENGFPNPATAGEKITAITMKMSYNQKLFVFGCEDFDNSRSDVTYIKCKDEIDLITRFIVEWTKNYPDIITGWNVKFFDIPYLVNRITKLCGEKQAKLLSPWNFLSPKTVEIFGRSQTTYFPIGTSILDYIDLYKKFAPHGYSQESYKLDAICHAELGEKKISYEEYGSLHSLYRENYQKFIEYNIRDVELVEKLDDKLKLLDLALTLAYNSKTNYEDVFSQVRMWDVLIFNKLKSMNIAIPPNTRNSKSESYVGAYVKDPKIGKHDWIASFDLNSLYPHLVMQYNISPDTIVEPENYSDELRNFLSNNVIDVDTFLTEDIDTETLARNIVTVTPNGQFFRVDRQGFLPQMMEEMYNDRSKFKKMAIEAKKKLSKEKNPEKKRLLENEASRYNNLQLALKVCLNSAYGALGNEYFRLFDVRQASAITTAGQLSIRWIENRLNEYMNKLLKTKGEDYVIASDTDSVYLSLAGIVNSIDQFANKSDRTREIIEFMDKVCDSKIQPVIDRSYSDLHRKTNAYAQKMQMKREALADKGLWTAKKRYILSVYNNEGVEYEKPDIKIMGLEMVKSSTPSSVRKKLTDSIDIIMNGTEKDMLTFIEDFRKEFKTLPPEEIAFPRGVNNIEKFSSPNASGIPIHVRGSIVYNHFLKRRKLTNKYPLINEGEKIKFIYLNEPNVLGTNVVSFPAVTVKELDLESIIDYNKQFEKAFLEPLKIILNVIGWKTEKVNSLEDFFV